MLAQIMLNYEDQNALNRAYFRICERSKKFGNSSDRIVLADIKKLRDAYETVITLRTNSIYRVPTDRELKQLHF